MTKCKLCGTKVRATSRAFVMCAEGGLQGALVCRPCEKRGVLIVPALPAVVGDGGKREKRELREVLAPFIRNLTAQVAAAKGVVLKEEDSMIACITTSRIETLENVIGLLKGGRA